MRIASISAFAAIAFIVSPAIAQEPIPGGDRDPPIRSQSPLDDEAPMADDDDIIRPAPTPAPAPVIQPNVTFNNNDRDMRRNDRNVFSAFGLEDRIVDVQLGVGSGDFFAEGPRESTEFGGTWDARAVVGTDSPVAVEAAYVGGAQGLRDQGTARDEDTILLNNGLEGGLKVGLPIEAGDTVLVKPFVHGGVGWKHYTLVGEGASTGGLANDDSNLTIPVGAGLDLGVGNLNIDARLTYRHAFDAELFGPTTGGFTDANAMHTWNVRAGVGFAF